ncbi:MAG: ATP-binding protein, partial [Candidatus Omnitrophica bacterium]|nr:ATP-binding protein [Candidatus Omnitrophota bacterium]
ATVSAVLIFMIAFLAYQVKGYLQQNVETMLFRQARLAVSIVETEKESVSVARLDTLADAIGADLAVRVTIIDREGVVKGDSSLAPEQIESVENHRFRPEIQQARERGQGVSVRFSTTVRKPFLYVALPCRTADFNGYVRLAMPLTDLGMLLQRFRHILWLGLLGGFALAALVSYLTAVYISRPVTMVARQARLIAAGDYSQRLCFRRDDEIGDLAESMQFMSEQIKKRLAEVAENKSRLEAVLLSMFEGVLMVDRQSKIIFMDKKLCELFGVREDPLGRSPIEIVRNLDIQRLTESAVQVKRKVQFKEISLLTDKDRRLLVHATAVMRGEEIDGAVLLFQDVTQLRRLEKIRQDFVTNVSHELRTPVSNIKGYAETLLDGALADPEHARDFLNVIHEESRRLTALINDLLDLARIESGELRLARAPVSVPTVIDAVAAVMARRLKEKELRFVVDIPGDLPPAHADSDKLQQVLVNLIDNSIKFTPAGGTITVRARRQEKLLQVEVEDTGVGIPDDALPRIFERFFRVDKARSRDMGGTGLGLSIVKHIIQAHRGEVSVRSTVGLGTVFTFTIPIAE